MVQDPNSAGAGSPRRCPAILQPAMMALIFFFFALFATAFGENEFTRQGGKSGTVTSLFSVGVAKRDVTPNAPVVLAGFLSRTTEHEGVDTKLWARALIIDEAVLVAIDNCGVPRAVTDRVADRLRDTHGIDPAHLIVAATHTHNAPALAGYAYPLWCDRFPDGAEQRMREYTAFVVDRMVAAVGAALSRRKPMGLEWTQGELPFSGHRRVINKKSGKVFFGSNDTGPVDRSLPVLAARDADGAVRAVWVNYASHSTVVGDRNRIGGDWPGFANEALEREFPGAVAFTTIGAGADSHMEPGELVRWMQVNLESGSLPLAKHYGTQIAAEAQRLLSKRATVVSLDGPLIIARSSVQLPLDKPNQTRQYWAQEANSTVSPLESRRCRARAMLKTLDTRQALPAEVDFPFSVWSFGKKLAMVFLAGEIVAAYAIRLKASVLPHGRETGLHLWVTGWSNAMPGYVPSRQMVHEGGYEVERAPLFYNQPSSFAPEVEDILVRAVTNLIPREQTGIIMIKPSKAKRWRTTGRSLMILATSEHASSMVWSCQASSRSG